MNKKISALDHNLDIAYEEGTQRTLTPEATLKFINPKLPLCGITRVPDITQLDSIGIPTCCAIRPTASVLQVSNGKGASKVAAQVSALMESIELFHVESSMSYQMLFQSASDFSKEQDVIEHQNIQSFRPDVYYSDRMKMHWYCGRNVINDKSSWIPASAIFFDQEPSVHRPTTNGLASGNHLIEASIHALYELIERDAGSRLSVNGKINVSSRGEVVDLKSIHDDDVKNMVELMSAKSKVVMCFVKSAINVYTFWVLLLNKNPLSSITTLNVGWGTHRNKEIAASRALTEAAQSRLTGIHGAREDIIVQAGYNNTNVQKSAAYRYFDQLKPSIRWTDLPDYPQSKSKNLTEDWQYLLSELEKNGFRNIYQFDLTRKGIDIPVVKMITPNLNFNQKLF